MGLLKFFKRQPSTLTGTSLRDALLAAATTKDFTTFGTLYNSHAATIHDEFPQWLKCPAEIIGDTAATQRYVEGLWFIAKVFEKSGDDTLMQSLTRPDDNPIARWQRDVAAADLLLDEGRAAEAVTLLEATLADVESVIGTAVDQFRPIILGRVGLARGWEPGPPAAEALHQEGRAAGSRGDLTEALWALTEAATLAPYWPYPVYDRAFTHLLLNDWEAALADYQHTLRLAQRDFFLTLAAIDTLQREAIGEFPHGLLLAFMSAIEVTDAVQRRQVFEHMVQDQPGFAPGWKEWARLAEPGQARLDALERGLSARPDAGTKGMLLVDKALALLSTDREGAKRLLREIARDPTSTAATEAMARYWLTQAEGSDASFQNGAR